MKKFHLPQINKSKMITSPTAIVALTFALLILPAIGAHAEMALSFSNALQKRCQTMTPHMSKKLLVHFMQSERSGEDFCDEQNVAIILKQCGQVFSCKDAGRVYLAIKQVESGNIIGQ